MKAMFAAYDKKQREKFNASLPDQLYVVQEANNTAIKFKAIADRMTLLPSQIHGRNDGKATQSEVDALLDKIITHGLSSLTEEEKKRLDHFGSNP